MTSVNVLEQGEGNKESSEQKTIKMFSKLPGWQCRPWQPDPRTTLINILSNPLLHPSHWCFFFSTLCWPLVSTSRHRGGSLMTPTPRFCSWLETLLKLSPHITFSLCLPAAYQRPQSPSLPPACLCRLGWTRAGRFSIGPVGFLGSRWYRRECPGERWERGRLSFVSIHLKRFGEVRPRCSLSLFSTIPWAKQTKHSMRR